MNWLLVIKLILGIAANIVTILRDKQVISGAQAEVMNELLQNTIEMSVKRDELERNFDNMPAHIRMRLRERYKANDSQ